MSHLRGRFTYELRPTDLEGPAAVAEFLELRRGYCTYFASAAVLMLRSEGLASRLATGFLAKEWSEEEGAWLVREKHSHAWIEVHFEGVGWLPFDPTPVSTASGGLPLELGDEEALGWLDNVRARLAGWVGSRGRDVGLGEVLQALLAGPARVLAAYPWAWLPAVAAVLLLARLLRGRGRPPDQAINLRTFTFRAFLVMFIMLLNRFSHVKFVATFFTLEFISRHCNLLILLPIFIQARH